MALVQEFFIKLHICCKVVFLIEVQEYEGVQMDDFKVKAIGRIGVDSGQIMISDPCYLKSEDLGDGKLHYDQDVKGNMTFKYDPTIMKKNFMTNMCEITLSNKGYGNYPNELRGGLHFGSQTMYGDGVYTIFGIFINGSNNPSGLFIDFEGDLRVDPYVMEEE